MAFPKRWHFVLVGILLILSVIAGASAGLVGDALRRAPSLDDVEFNPELTTFIYDRHGRVINRYFTQNRIPVRLEQVPDVLKQAVLAIEDTQFYEHHGVNFQAILRALIRNIREDRTRPMGGSTITQQLAKMVFTGDEVSMSRKIHELMWSFQIERKYTKDEIFETYLNEVYFGHSTHGVQAASQMFFGKDVQDITLAEAALLAGVLNGPGVYSPRINMDAALRRRAIVLNRMAEVGFITQAEADAAKEEPIVLAESMPRRNEAAPYFVEHVRQELRRLGYDDRLIETGGLRVYTTLDMELQLVAERLLDEFLPVHGQLERDGRTVRQPQAALVALDPSSGDILAMVGGRGEDFFNRATQAVRQPGSAMKPFVYAAAIERLEIHPATIVVDEPISLELINGDIYEPQNYNQQFGGPMTVRRALEDSINIPAIKVGLDIGIDTVVRYAQAMGVTTLVTTGRENDLGPATAIGGLTNGVSPLQMAAAYAVFANEGIYTQPRSILRVVGQDGRELDDDAFRPRRRTALKEETAYIMTDMMRGVIERGTGWRANIGRPAAGKTGTTQDNQDAWFIGYTPELVTAVWIGHDTPTSMPFGSALPAQIWREFMLAALSGKPVQRFDEDGPPPGIVGPMLVDLTTGLLVPEGCRLPQDQVRSEIFVWGSEPKAYTPSCIWASMR